MVAEFCRECFNKLHETNYGVNEIILSRDLDLYEGCGKYLPVVERIGRRSRLFLLLARFLRIRF